MSTVLWRAVLVDGRVPAAGELLECAHIHAAVMQVAPEVRHVMVEELLIGADGVAGQQRAHAFRREAQHVFGDLLPRPRPGSGHSPTR